MTRERTEAEKRATAAYRERMRHPCPVCKGDAFTGVLCRSCSSRLRMTGSASVKGGEHRSPATS